ncbi:hypothetical protein L484_019216 [Morus notabilis]|uniref:Uncharacterized protein n=1 Tax=Morus notabilis TaxID=981085 RepID=W9RD14_9ROSA|nr:hypothetical protein L484_019216 [Morus notabilis]
MRHAYTGWEPCYSTLKSNQYAVFSVMNRELPPFPIYGLILFDIREHKAGVVDKEGNKKAAMQIKRTHY